MPCGRWRWRLTTASSAWNSRTWPLIVASPKRLAAARRRAGALWTAESGARNARSAAVDAKGIPLGTVTVPANRHDSPLLAETLDAAAEALGGLPEATSIHLDRGYDSDTTHGRLRERGLVAEISKKGKPAPLTATKRWVVERTSSWHKRS